MRLKNERKEQAMKYLSIAAAFALSIGSVVYSGVSPALALIGCE